jgi:hypothetical protein
MPEHGMETSYIACQKEVQNSTIGEKSDVDNFGMHNGQFLNVTKREAQQ